MSSPTKLREMAKELGWPPELEKAADQLQKLKRENAALRKDKERLDWLEEQSDNMGWLHQCRYSSIRSAIDAARKEPQP